MFLPPPGDPRATEPVPLPGSWAIKAQPWARGFAGAREGRNNAEGLEPIAGGWPGADGEAGSGVISGHSAFCSS